MKTWMSMMLAVFFVCAGCFSAFAGDSHDGKGDWAQRMERDAEQCLKYAAELEQKSKQADDKQSPIYQELAKLKVQEAEIKKQIVRSLRSGSFKQKEAEFRTACQKVTAQGIALWQQLKGASDDKVRTWDPPRKKGNDKETTQAMKHEPSATAASNGKDSPSSSEDDLNQWLGEDTSAKK